MKTDLLTIQRKRYPEFYLSAGLRGIDGSPSWIQLLDDLCNSLRNHLDRHPLVPTIAVTRVKEKWGEHRPYHDGGDRRWREIVDRSVTASLQLCEVCRSNGAG